MIKMYEGVFLGFFLDIYSRKLKVLCFKCKIKKFVFGYLCVFSLFVCKIVLGIWVYICL